MRRHFLLIALATFLLHSLASALSADSEGLSRTSWGRFGWWETSIGAYNRTNVDGLLAYNVTLEGLNGVIRTRPGDQWAGGPPYMTEPLKGNSRIWNVRFGAAGSARSIIVLSRTWKFSTDPDKQGMTAGWQKPDFDDSNWRPMMVGPLEDAQYEAAGPFEKEKGGGWGMQKSTGSGKSGSWENQGLEYDGVAWYRLRALIPIEWKGEKVYFHVLGIDDEDTTFVNGVQIGETTVAKNPGAYTAERTYEIPADTIKWGENNSFVVRVNDISGGGGFTGSAPEIVRGEKTLEAQSIKPKRAGEAPSYIKSANWVTKTIELPDFTMTYSLASALVRVKVKGSTTNIGFDAPIDNVAYVTRNGIRIQHAEDGLLYHRSREMTENWLLFWHGSAVGANEDLPMLLVLHGKPEFIAVNGSDIVVGGGKDTFNIGPPFGLRHFSGRETQKWLTAGLPADVVNACRFWSRAALAYPIGNTESYFTDHDREMVKVTEKYTYDIVQDDWGTKPLKIAAVPPILACITDAGYPAKMLTKRTDPGFISYAGPFAATVDSDTASFELPIPVEDEFAGLSTPGDEAELDHLTRGSVNLANRWTGWPWANMGLDKGQEPLSPAGKGEPMPFDEARERALLGTYPVIGIPQDHIPGQPIPTPWTSTPLNNSFHWPPFLIANERVQPGLRQAVRIMSRNLDSAFSDESFNSGVFRVEVEPTFKKPMTYLAPFRYENITDRLNGEAPYDFTSISGHLVWGFKEGGVWTGDWRSVKRRWGKILQVSDSYWRNHDWATAACDNKDSRPNSSVDITWDNFAGLEGLARCAYAIGDTKTYEFLCYLRARLAMGIVAHEALQQYLQPVILWPDNYFAGHLGEPYPPYRSGLLAEGGVAMEWNPPYPEGAINQVPWRFNNAGTTCPGVGLRWMAMTMPRHVRWVLDRMDRYVPHWYEGQRNEYFAPKPGAPYYQNIHRDVAANTLMMSYFIGTPVSEVKERWAKLCQAPTIIPFSIERMSIIHGRGQFQNMLFTEACPMWASTWEPRQLSSGKYEPSTGTAKIVVEPGSAALRFTAGSRVRPASVSLNGKTLPERAALKDARAKGGWTYLAWRQTIYVMSPEKGKIDLAFRFKPNRKTPKPKVRMVSDKPVTAPDVNLLADASFDRHLQDISHSTFVGPVGGPYLYTGRWMAPDAAPDWVCALLTSGQLSQVPTPWRSAGASLRMCSGKDVQIVQNTAANPGKYAFTVYLHKSTDWIPTSDELRLTLTAYTTAKGNLTALKEATTLVTPDILKDNEWTQISVRIDAPLETQALQAKISFLPLTGDGDKERKFPVYADDADIRATQRP